MQKFLSVFLSLSLFLSLFFTSANSTSAEIVEEIEGVEIVEEFELTGAFEASTTDSISTEGDFKTQKLSLPNIINITTSTNGDYIEVYASNIGVDTVDLVTTTFVVQRYNHNQDWVEVRRKTMTLKDLKPGKKLMEKIYNPQNYGYEKLILSFVANDGKDVTSDSQEMTRIKNPYNWRDITTLADHTYRHASDFGLSYNEMTYSQKANQHYKNRSTTGYEYFSDASGNIRVYHASTNSFGSYDSSGKTRTYFKPSRGKDYWKDQKDMYLK